MADLASAPWLRRLISIALLSILVLLGFRVVEPFIVPVVWAAILAYVSWPAYEWLTRKLGGRALLAASLMTIAVSAAVIVPIAWLAVALRLDLIHAYHQVQDTLVEGVQLPPVVLKVPWIGDHLRDLAARIAADPHALGLELRKLSDRSFDQIARLVGDIGRNAVKLAFAVLTLFFLYRGGESFAAQVARALGLVLGPRVENYLNAIGQTVKAVVWGLGASAVLQGVLAGLGYWAAGIGAPFFLGALTIVFGIIPFAVPVVWFGVSLWLLVTGHTVAGVSLAVWGAIVIGATDHFVRPVLIARTARIPFLLVLFGVLGGLASFGLVGLFIGPVILAILLAIWREWLLESGQPHAG
jgi:predicted PurR-regulated permease PerM